MHTETEHKFIIKLPDSAYLEAFEKSSITQIYLINPDASADRVRKRVFADRIELTHTVKKRISKMSASEDESIITQDEYNKLLERRDPNKNVIYKDRYVLPYAGHTLEIDIYPFWKKQAVLEIELESEDEAFLIPNSISVIQEVTGNHAYSNNALSEKIPEEL